VRSANTALKKSFFPYYAVAMECRRFEVMLPSIHSGSQICASPWTKTDRWWGCSVLLAIASHARRHHRRIWIRVEAGVGATVKSREQAKRRPRCQGRPRSRRASLQRCPPSLQCTSPPRMTGELKKMRGERICWFHRCFLGTEFGLGSVVLRVRVGLDPNSTQTENN